MRFTPSNKRAPQQHFTKTLIQLATPIGYSFKSYHQYLSHPYSLPQTTSNSHRTTAPICPLFWQRWPTDQTVKLIQLCRCLIGRRLRKNSFKRIDHQQLSLLDFPPLIPATVTHRSNGWDPKISVPRQLKLNRSKDPKFLFFLSHLPFAAPLFYSLKLAYRQNNK